ncbi:hypothetical protein SKAU_G00244760 [Synaphobranchus kaupii]|uniref:Transmembrane protein n=1 Tax=Synaphobranchus kaupii TaxID=118154 RepID=A0A9Q1F1V2_SYNKA|nr:hypothetical protein SKAU_G00244760 [Synaphobranchus kaupii]
MKGNDQAILEPEHTPVTLRLRWLFGVVVRALGPTGTSQMAPLYAYVVTSLAMWLGFVRLSGVGGRDKMQVLTEQQDRNGQVGPSTFTRTEEEAEGDFSSEEDSPDIVLVRSNPVPRAAEPPVIKLTLPAGTREQEDEPPTMRDSGGGQMSLVPLEPHEEVRGGPRRSARATAGYHPNPFNLPRPISRPPLDGDGVAAHLVVNSVQVPHRPWE